MNTKQILADLCTERDRIDRAISALEGLDGEGTPRMTATSVLPAQTRGRRRRLTPAGRKRLSELAKARWAARRKGATKLQSNKTGAHKPMSAATKKRLSVLAKKRWAQRKKAATTA